MSARDELLELAESYGVEASFYDALGNHRVASDAALLAVLRSLGAEISGTNDAIDALRGRRRAIAARLVEPVVVAWQGRRPSLSTRRPAGDGSRVRVELSLEDGSTRRLDARFDALPLEDREEIDGCVIEKRRLEIGELPFGYHHAAVEAGGAMTESLIVSAPFRAHVPEGLRAWGAFLPVYALHGSDSFDGGSVTDLEALVDFVAELGGAAVGTLPLLATFLDEPYEPSPYAPVSRLFWNEIFVDPRRCPELERSEKAQQVLASEAFARETARLRDRPLVSYREWYALIDPLLDELARAFFAEGSPDELARYLEETPRARDYARFRAATERLGPFDGWEPRLRDGSLDDGDVDAARVRHHLYAQLRASEQIGHACERARALGLGMYLDVPLGVHAAGYDAWRERDSYLEGVSAGAPPDALFTGGQAWGFRPLSPDGLRASRYRYLIETVRHQMSAAGVLRIDHVMGLHRLYCIPDGMTATDGLYVHFAHEELYAILTLESVRHATMLVGEDLGTVPDAVRAAMDAHALHRMYVLPFELRPAEPMIMGNIAECTVASANTHDLPTFRGFWDASDVEIRREMGLLDDEAAEREKSERVALTRTLAERLGQPHEPAAVLRRALEAIAGSDCRLMLVNLEDLWLEPDPQNVPGTHRERPNWRRKSRLSVDQIRASDEVLTTLRAIAALRPRSARPQVSDPVTRRE